MSSYLTENNTYYGLFWTNADVCPQSCAVREWIAPVQCRAWGTELLHKKATCPKIEGFQEYCGTSVSRGLSCFAGIEMESCASECLSAPACLAFTIVMDDASPICCLQFSGDTEPDRKHLNDYHHYVRTNYSITEVVIVETTTETPIYDDNYPELPNCTDHAGCVNATDCHAPASTVHANFLGGKVKDQCPAKCNVCPGVCGDWNELVPAMSTMLLEVEHSSCETFTDSFNTTHRAYYTSFNQFTPWTISDICYFPLYTAALIYDAYFGKDIAESMKNLVSGDTKAVVMDICPETCRRRVNNCPTECGCDGITNSRECAAEKSGYTRYCGMVVPARGDCTGGSDLDSCEEQCSLDPECTAFMLSWTLTCCLISEDTSDTSEFYVWNYDTFVKNENWRYADGTNMLPYCSWINNCRWNDETKQECADAMCRAQGFLNATYVRATNNMCRFSAVDGELHWYWNTDTNQYEWRSDFRAETAITAECHFPDSVPIPIMTTPPPDTFPFQFDMAVTTDLSCTETAEHLKNTTERIWGVSELVVDSETCGSQGAGDIVTFEITVTVMERDLAYALMAQVGDPQTEEIFQSEIPFEISGIADATPLFFGGEDGENLVSASDETSITIPDTFTVMDLVRYDDELYDALRSATDPSVDQSTLQVEMGTGTITFRAGGEIDDAALITALLNTEGLNEALGLANSANTESSVLSLMQQDSNGNNFCIQLTLGPECSGLASALQQQSFALEPCTLSDACQGDTSSVMTSLAQITNACSSATIEVFCEAAQTANAEIDYTLRFASDGTAEDFDMYTDALIQALSDHMGYELDRRDVEVSVQVADGVASITWSVYDANAVAIMQGSDFQSEFQQTLQEISGLDALLGLETYTYSFTITTGASPQEVLAYENELLAALNYNEVEVEVTNGQITWYVYDDNVEEMDNDSILYSLQGVEGLRELLRLQSVTYTLNVTTGATVEELEEYPTELYVNAVADTSGAPADRVTVEITGDIIWKVYDASAADVMNDPSYNQALLDTLCADLDLAALIGCGRVVYYTYQYSFQNGVAFTQDELLGLMHQYGGIPEDDVRVVVDGQDVTWYVYNFDADIPAFEDALHFFEDPVTQVYEMIVADSGTTMDDLMQFEDDLINALANAADVSSDSVFVEIMGVGDEVTISWTIVDRDFESSQEIIDDMLDTICSLAELGVILGCASSAPSYVPSLQPTAPTLSPSPIPTICMSYPPSREIYYDCNSDFIADADCFDGGRFTCESCCYTDMSVDGRRPCWTPQHTKMDCCGNGTNIAPTQPPDFFKDCWEDPTTTPSVEPTPTEPSAEPSFSAPSPVPLSNCISRPPSRQVYYDCNSQFVADSDCFGGRYTCESCCYTDLDVNGQRPCWTPQHQKEDCCGDELDAPAVEPVPPEGMRFCDEEVETARPSMSLPSMNPVTSPPSPLPTASPIASQPTASPSASQTTASPSYSDDYCAVLVVGSDCLTNGEPDGCEYDMFTEFNGVYHQSELMLQGKSIYFHGEDEDGKRLFWNGDNVWTFMDMQANMMTAVEDGDMPFPVSGDYLYVPVAGTNFAAYRDVPITCHSTHLPTKLPSSQPSNVPSPEPTASIPSFAPTLTPVFSSPTMSPSAIPLNDCGTVAPSREVYYDCNSQFVADADCFYGIYTCESCCYTDRDINGRRPCWTPQHSKEDCCGDAILTPPTVEPDQQSSCADLVPSATPSISRPTDIPSSIPSKTPSATPSASTPTKTPTCITAPPTRSVYYDCNSQFVADADCFGGRYTCESCCYTDLDVNGQRPCWTPQHSKQDCCGDAIVIESSSSPDERYCQDEEETTEVETTITETTEAPETTEAVTTTRVDTTDAPETTEAVTTTRVDTTDAPETTEAVTTMRVETTEPATTAPGTTEAPTDAFCSCVGAFGICDATCTDVPSVCAPLQEAECIDQPLETYCYDTCLSVCVGFDDSNEGRISCLRRRLSYLTEEETRLREEFDEQKQTCDETFNSISTCMTSPN